MTKLEVRRDDIIAKINNIEEKKMSISNSKIILADYDFFELHMLLSQLENVQPSVFRTSFFMKVLFVLFETVPLIIKLLSPRGLYDEMLAVNEEVYFAQLIKAKENALRSLNKKSNGHTDIKDKKALTSRHNETNGNVEKNRRSSKRVL